MRILPAAATTAIFAVVALLISLAGPAPAHVSAVVAFASAPIVHTPPPDPIGVRSAAPTVTSVALTSTDGTNVKCPATIHVTATVGATPGKYLHVVVRGFFNGGFVTIDGTQSLPDDQLMTGTSFSRTYAVTLPVLNGETNDGVQLTAWQDGDAFPFTTASTNAQFVPTCQAPPTPTPSPSPAPTPNGSDLGIPSDVLAVHDAAVCQGLVLSSTLGSGCAQAVQKGDVVLAWSYKLLSRCSPHCTTPSGFLVERAAYEGGAYQAYQLVNYQASTPESDGLIMGVPYATIFGQCYRVSALKGAADVGPASTPVCIKPDSVTLSATAIYPAERLEHDKSGALCSPNANPLAIQIDSNVPSDAFVVGFRDSFTFSRALQCEENYYSRYQADIVFPVETLALKKVKHATLTATVVKAAQNLGNGVPNVPDNGDEKSVQASCVAHLGFPTNFRPGGSIPPAITYDDAVDVTPGAPAGSLSVDVTSMVQAWLHPGGINNGVVLTPQIINGTDGYSSFNDITRDNSDCVTLYANPKLVITY